MLLCCFTMNLSINFVTQKTHMASFVTPPPQKKNAYAENMHFAPKPCLCVNPTHIHISKHNFVCISHNLVLPFSKLFFVSISILSYIFISSIFISFSSFLMTPLVFASVTHLPLSDHTPTNLPPVVPPPHTPTYLPNCCTPTVFPYLR